MVLPIFGIRLKKYWYVKLMWWGFFYLPVYLVLYEIKFDIFVI